MNTSFQIKFRWPVKQVDDRKIEVQVPTGPGTPLIVRLDKNVANELKLSDKEFDKALDAAEEAAIRSILIIE